MHARDPHSDTPTRPESGPDSAFDAAFFVFGGASAVWLAYLLLQEGITLGWGQIWFSFAYWVLLAYIVLPRLHRILTRIYVPDYFIGRARTSDGLLGDPINLALLGSEAQVHEAMTHAGWVRADDVTMATGWRIVSSTVLRRSYREAPVSPLLLFGRTQDFAYQQEVAGNPGRRHHVRFWRCPTGWLLPGGRRADWLAAGTYDRSVGLSLFTLQITHKIDARTDQERDHIVESVLYTNDMARFTTIRDFSTGYHARNGGGDAIETDGDLPVLDLRLVRPRPGFSDLPATSRYRRPGATILGAVLVAGRALAAGVLLITAMLALQDPAAELTRDERALLRLTVGVLAAFVAAEILLSALVFRGRNRARVLAMTLGSLSVVVQAVMLGEGGPRITFATNLTGLSIDVLLILALSSERARMYAKRRRTMPPGPSDHSGDAAP